MVQVSHFILLSIAAALSHRNPSSIQTSHKNCYVQDSDKADSRLVEEVQSSASNFRHLVCGCYVAGLSVGDVVSECRLNQSSGSAYTQIPHHHHHQQTIPLHNTSTPQVSLHNTTNSRKLLKMDVLTSETC